jgi:hypothetical protein
MALVSGPTLNNAISDPNNAVAKMAKTQKDDHAVNKQLISSYTQPTGIEERGSNKA